MPDSTSPAWLCPVTYSDKQSTELIVYCGDGRFGSSIECFVSECLGLERCARLVVPGGPACLAGGAPPFYASEDGAAAQFFFLVDALRIKRVHLMAHDRCAFYMQKLGVCEAELRARQVRDLGTVVKRVSNARPKLSVHAWLAEVRDDHVAFLSAQALQAVHIQSADVAAAQAV